MGFPTLHVAAAASLNSCSGVPRPAYPRKTTYRHHLTKSSPNLLSRPLFQSISNTQICKCRFRDDFTAPFQPSSLADAAAVDSTHHSSSMPTNALFRKMGWIGIGTITSKILGMLREIVLAAIFGVGPVTTAFRHAYVVPGFFMSHLGGVNGPLHVTVATTLSNHPKEIRRNLIQNASTVMFMVGGILCAIVCMSADSIIYFSAPGLWSLANGRVTRQLAIMQLKLMTPCILLAGPVGLGFGSLSAEGDHIIPSLSPSLSSICIIVMCAIYIFMTRSNNSHPRDVLFGGIFLSCGFSVGAFLQWLIQVFMNKKTGDAFIFSSWKNIKKDKDLHKVFVLMLPAILSSGLVQVASLTDLYFASFIPGAAAALSYAHLLAMAPLGIVLSTILLPIIPTFTKLEKPSSWPILKGNLQQAILLCVAIVLPIVSSICVLAKPIISFLFQRFAFDSAACSLVSSLLLCYSIGSPFYIIRELLVVVYYSLGEGKPPFFITVVAILLNAFLDWLLTFHFHLGAQGLVLSTSSVTALSTLFLFYLLSSKLPGLVDFQPLLAPLLWLSACCIISGFTTMIGHEMLWRLLSRVSILRFCRLSQLVPILLASLLGLFAFFCPLLIFQFPGMKLLKDLLTTLSNQHKSSMH